MVLECLFDAMGNDAIAQSYSDTSLCMREIWGAERELIFQSDVWFCRSLWLGVGLGRTSAWFGSRVARRAVRRTRVGYLAEARIISMLVRCGFGEPAEARRLKGPNLISFGD